MMSGSESLICHDPHPAARVRGQPGAEIAHLRIFAVDRKFSGRDLAVKDAERPRHLGEDRVQFGAVADARNQRLEPGADPVPVNPAQLRIIGKVAVEAPGIEEHLVPFLARIDLQPPVGEADAVWDRPFPASFRPPAPAASSGFREVR